MGFERFDAAFENEGREDIRLACVVEVAQEVGEQWVVAAGDEGCSVGRSPAEALAKAGDGLGRLEGEGAGVGDAIGFGGRGRLQVVGARGDDVADAASRVLDVFW